MTSTSPAVTDEVDAVEDLLRPERLRDAPELDDRERAVALQVLAQDPHDEGLGDRQLSPHGRERKIFVRKKSVARTVMDATTTAIVVARPTPSAPAGGVQAVVAADHRDLEAEEGRLAEAVQDVVGLQATA